MIFKILVFIIFFLLLGGFLIISNENIRLDSGKNVDKFIYEYKFWLNKQVNSSFKIAGKVIKNNLIRK
jgi:hypothetical protein